MIVQILIILDNGVFREPLPTLIILLDQAITDILRIIMLLDPFYVIMIGAGWEDLDLQHKLLILMYISKNHFSPTHVNIVFKMVLLMPITGTMIVLSKIKILDYSDRQITPESRSKQSFSDDANNTYWHLLVPGHFNQNGSKLTAAGQYVVKNASSGEIIPYLLDTGSTLSVIPEYLVQKYTFQTKILKKLLSTKQTQGILNFQKICIVDLKLSQIT